MRRTIAALLDAEADLQVVGQAADGDDALRKVESLLPDVVTLDVQMPGLDGLEVLRRIMRTRPKPVVMLSYLTRAGAAPTLKALLIGAVDVVAKPSGPISLDLADLRDDLPRKVRAAAQATVRPGLHGETEGAAASAPAGSRTSRPLAQQLVVIGASTGGPGALATIVPDLPCDGGVAYLVVQHMPAWLTVPLAERLGRRARMPVRVIEDGDRLLGGTVFLAPGDFHVRVDGRQVWRLDQGPKVKSVRPSVDVALQSAAAAFGPRLTAAILTGMGDDGADGTADVRSRGGAVLAEHESTCVVWGMPRVVAERGLADRVVPLTDMARAIGDLVTRPALASC